MEIILTYFMTVIKPDSLKDYEHINESVTICFKKRKSYCIGVYRKLTLRYIKNLGVDLGLLYSSDIHAMYKTNGGSPVSSRCIGETNGNFSSSVEHAGGCPSSSRGIGQNLRRWSRG